ncbi:energy-coupling factor transporter transmembrane component T family protein, partial [Rodentibacter pneumotropicus]
IQALGKLPLPEKLIQLFALTVRYIALLGELRQKMDRAMRARGYQPKFNFRTLYVTAQSVALLLIHALLKAEMAQIALKCRGFQFGKRKEDAER